MKNALSGALLVAALLLTVPAQADDTISADARAHFNAGVSFLQDPDGARYEEAYREFKAAYSDSPSWKILGNLGITAMKLERDGEAIEAFQKYLAEGGSHLEADERAQVERDLATLKASAANITLESVPAGATILDERFPASGAPVQNSYGPLNGALSIGVRAGRHRITAKLAGRPDSVWEIELSPKQQASHTFQFAEEGGEGAAKPTAGDRGEAHVASGGANGLRVASYVALGVGVVGLGAGTYFGLSAKSSYEEGNELCPSSGTCTLTTAQANRRTELGKEGDDAKTLSLIGFIAGGVGVAAGVTLFVLSGDSNEKPAHARLYVGPSELGVAGTF